MFCANCGTKNDDNVKFCPNCGNIINNNSAVSQSQNNKNNEFISSDNFIKIKSQIDSIKDQPDTELSDNNINQLSEIINADETILYFTSGFSAFGSDSILMVLTSNRVIIAKWGILAPIKEKISIPLETINKVSSVIGIMGAEITIEHRNNSEYITDIGKESGKLFEYKLNRELEKYKKEEQYSDAEKTKENQNIDLPSNRLDKTKERYLFFKNIYINCSSIQEIKKEENTILIITSKNTYYLKYDSESSSLNNYNRLISFVTDEVLELSDDEK